MSPSFLKESNEETQLEILPDSTSSFGIETGKTQGSAQNVPAMRANSSANYVIKEKLQEEIFGRIAKNLKWIISLHDMTLSALKTGAQKSDAETSDVYGLLLGRICSAAQCFSTSFIPILASLYPHKYEVSEIFGKYVAASYGLAGTTNTTAYVTEEFWQETLPYDAVEDFIDSEKRIIEILIPRKDESPNDLSILIRHLYVATGNLRANVEQLRYIFKDDPYVITLASNLYLRILQIEDASSILYKRSTKSSDERDGVGEKSEEQEVSGNEQWTFRKQPQHENGDRSIDALLALKTGKAPDKNSKKWLWNGTVKLVERPEVLVKKANY